MPIFPQSGSEIPELLTIRELARILKVSQRSIWRLVAAGKLSKPLYVGGSARWRGDYIKHWIDQGCIASENEKSPKQQMIDWSDHGTIENTPKESSGG